MFGTAEWSKIRDLCIESNYRILRSSPIVVLVGKAALAVFEEKLRRDLSFELKRATLQLKVFEEDPFFYIVYKNREVQQLVFYSNHGSWFLYGAQLKEGIYSDFIWNLAAHLACIEVILPDSFSQCAAVTSSKGWATLPDHEKARAFREIHRVKSEADWIPAKEVKPKEFRNFEHYRQAVVDREPAAMAVVVRRGKTKATNASSLRLNKLHALLQSQEVIEFLEKPASFYTVNTIGEVYTRIANHHDWPMRWDDITPGKQGKYGASLRKYHRKLSEWNQSDAAF